MPSTTPIWAAVRHGFHALALDETRDALPRSCGKPARVAGQCRTDVVSRRHGDVGGQLGGFHAARPLSNIPLVWMLERAETCGLALPPGWRARFPCDPERGPLGRVDAGVGEVLRAAAAAGGGGHPSEAVHPTAVSWGRGRGSRLARGRGAA